MRIRDSRDGPPMRGAGTHGVRAGPGSWFSEFSLDRLLYGDAALTMSLKVTGVVWPAASAICPSTV